MEKKDLELLKIRSIVQVLFIFLGVLLTEMLAAVLWNAVCVLLHYIPDDGTRLMQMSVVSSLLITAWCGYLYYHSPWRIRPFDYRQAFTVRTLVSAVGIAMGGCILLTFLLSALQSCFPQFFAEYNKTMGQFEQGERMVTLLHVLLIGPVTEELIFRGAMFDRLRLACSFWAANVLQAALFGVFHMNLIQGLYAFAWGILLGIIYQAAGSILVNILAHMVFNLTNYLMGWLFPPGRAVSTVWYAGTFLAGTVFFAVGLCYTIRVCKQVCAEQENDDRDA